MKLEYQNPIEYVNFLQEAMRSDVSDIKRSKDSVDSKPTLRRLVKESSDSGARYFKQDGILMDNIKLARKRIQEFVKSYYAEALDEKQIISAINYIKSPIGEINLAKQFIMNTVGEYHNRKG